MSLIINPKTQQPKRVQKLPEHQGLKIPYSVAIDEGGKPNYNLTDAEKYITCIRENKCFICGQTLGKHKAFMLPPLAVLRLQHNIPPSHRDCAIWSAETLPSTLNNKPMLLSANDQKQPEQKTGLIMIAVTTKAIYTATNNSPEWSFTNKESEILINEAHWYLDGKQVNYDEVQSHLNKALGVITAEINQSDSEVKKEAIETLHSRYRLLEGFMPNRVVV